MGLAVVYGDQVRDGVLRSELVPVLEDLCEPFPGYYVYDPHQTLPVLLVPQ